MKTFKKFSVILFLTLFCSILSFSRTYESLKKLVGKEFSPKIQVLETAKKVAGKVIENESKTPISYVTICLYNSSDSTLFSGTITDENGEFVLKNIVAGSYYITLNFIGYETKTISNFEIKNDDLDFGEITLSIATSLLNEVTISENKLVLVNSIDKQIVNVSSNLTATGGTAIDALRTAPSVSVDSDDNIAIRGNSNITVLINGQPTSMSASEILKSTPADIISKIEVITNPSVKYTAEGTGGIINIILKKDIQRGFNGMIDATVGTGDKYSSNLSLNMNLKKVNISTGFEWKDYNTAAIHNYERNLTSSDTAYYAFMGQDRLLTEKDAGFRFNIDYNPNETNNFAYSLNAGVYEFALDLTAKTHGESPLLGYEKFMINTFDLSTRPTYFTNNLTYSKIFNDKGTNLTLNTYYSHIDYKFVSKQSMTEIDKDENIIDNQPYLQNTYNNNYSDDIRFSLDYTHVLNEKLSIESGLSYDNYKRYIDVVFDQYDYESNSFKHNSFYTNKFDFSESVYSSYINVTGSVAGFDFSTGLRVEYMDRLLKQKTLDKSYGYDKLNFFPGLTISRNLLNDQTIGLSLTNRINRPDEYMMNPFPEFEDDYFYSEGNPYLIPEITRSLDLNYQKMFEKLMLSTDLYYKTTTNKIQQIMTLNNNDKTAISSHNDCSDYTAGLEISANYQATDWWSIMMKSNAYYYSITSKIEEKEYVKEKFSYDAMLMNSFSIGKTTSLQVISYYQSPTAWSQGEISDFYFVDLGVTQSLLDEKLSLNFKVKDVFNSLNYSLYTESEGMTLTGDFNNESPTFLLTASFQISKYDKLTKDVDTEFDM
jgi:outer membrane receptor protein involved in Fe transport